MFCTPLGVQVGLIAVLLRCVPQQQYLL